jgi:monovalent cation:H+ antiporter, CPA1 family
MAEQVLSDADRLIEGARSGGRSGYQRAAKKRRLWPSFRAAVRLHNRLRPVGPLARLTADRFELLLSQRLILRDLGTASSTGASGASTGGAWPNCCTSLLSRRIETVETALDGLRLQYPGYAEELERRFIRRTALRLEEREYDRDARGRADRRRGLHRADAGSRRPPRRGRGAPAPRHRASAGRARAAVSAVFRSRRAPRSSRLRPGAQDALRQCGRRYPAPEARRGSVFFIASGAVELERGPDLAAWPGRDVRADGDPDEQGPPRRGRAPSRPRRFWCWTRRASGAWPPRRKKPPSGPS